MKNGSETVPILAAQNTKVHRQGVQQTSINRNRKEPVQVQAREPEMSAPADP